MVKTEIEWQAYRPYIVGVALGLLLLNSWYLLSIAVENTLIPKWYDQTLSIINGAIGAFIGAYAAFLLQSDRESKSEHEKKGSALNEALFIMGRQANALEMVKRDYEAYDNETSLALYMPAYKPPDYSGLKIDLDSLMFILDTEDPQLLLELSIEQERFEQAMAAIEVRNTFYLDKIQPALSKLSSIKGPPTKQSIDEIFGENLFKGAIKGVREIKRHIGGSIISQEKISKKLWLLAKQLYPKRKFISFEILKPEQT